MEEGASQLLGVICSLLNPITRYIEFCTNSAEYIAHLRQEMRDLKFLKGDVEAKVKAAKDRNQKCKQQVEGWLQKVDEIEHEVTEIEHRFEQREKCLGQCHPNCWSSYKIGKKSAKMIQLVQNATKDGSFSSVVLEDIQVVEIVEEIPFTRAVGIEATLEKFKGLMTEEEVEIICIHGMGGAGKTTLLKTINNEFVQENHDFAVVIWVTVPRGLPGAILVREVQEEVGRRLGLHLPETTEVRAKMIHRYLKHKKFMLLLDDLWERLDLDKVGIPHSRSQNKSKIAFTTRSAEVCSDMSAHRRIKVEPLKDVVAWELFRRNVGDHVDGNSSHIQPHARTIVGRCGGLPLALVIVGRAVANKETINEWKDVVRALKNAPHEVQKIEAELYPVLKISCDNLHDDTMKSCFLYCCLFPEGNSISIEQLVDYYIGEGFFYELSNAEEARNKAHATIAQLKAANMLEKDDDDEERRVNLHDVMRHLAVWIASERSTKTKFLVHVGTEAPEIEDGKEIPELEKWQEAERIWLTDKGIKALTETPHCPKLFTLILRNNRSLVHISNNFFESMPALKVLDLSTTDIEELPEGIGMLLELQYLNLMHTKIKSLPAVLKRLVKLKHLNLSHTNLSSNPFEVILSFTKLQVLNLYRCSCENSEGGLEELRRLKFLSTLGINMNSATDMDKILNSIKLVKCVRYLLISDCQNLPSIWLPSLHGNDRSLRLQVLEIRTCKDLENLTIGAETEQERECLSSLEELTLEVLPNMKIIWKETVPRGCFHRLRSVHIAGCHRIRNITWVVHLENLRALHLSSCNGIKDIILSEGETQEEELLAFSELREMELRGLPKLKSIYSRALPFPCLKDLYILDCPKLKKLPLTALGIKKNLQGIRGTQEWWNELQWEDDNAKEACCFLAHKFLLGLLSGFILAHWVRVHSCGPLH